MLRDDIAADEYDCFTTASTATEIKGDAGDRMNRARLWIEAAIAAGADPLMIQQPLWSTNEPGEWKLVTFKGNPELGSRAEPFPSELWDETFLVLETLDRVWRDSDAELWDGRLFPENCSGEAIALRLRLARNALNLDLERFYECCGISVRAAKALEAGRRRLNCWRDDIFRPVCDAHKIPEFWLLFGEPIPR